MADSVFGIPTPGAMPVQQLSVPQINPMQQPQNDFAFAGALGGAVGGTQLQNNQNIADANLRANNLDYANALLGYQNNVADQPLRDQFRAAESLGLGQSTDLLKSGLPLQAAKSGLTAQMKQNLAKGSAADLENAYNHYQGMIPLASYAEQTPDLLTNQGAQEHLRELGKAAGIDMPDVIDQKAIDHLKKMKPIALETVNYLQNSGLLGQKYTQEVGKENAAQGVGSLPLGKSYDLLSAQLMFQAQAGLRLGMQTNDEKVQREIHDKMSAGQPLNESDITSLTQIKLKEGAAAGASKEAVSAAKTQVRAMSNEGLAQVAAQWIGGDPKALLKEAQSNRPALLTKVDNAIEAKMPAMRAENEAKMALAGAKVQKNDGSVVTYRMGPSGIMQEVPLSGSQPKAKSTSSAGTSTAGRTPPPGSKEGDTFNGGKYVVRNGRVVPNTPAAAATPPAAAPTARGAAATATPPTAQPQGGTPPLNTGGANILELLQKALGNQGLPPTAGAGANSSGTF